MLRFDDEWRPTIVGHMGGRRLRDDLSLRLTLMQVLGQQEVSTWGAVSDMDSDLRSRDKWGRMAFRSLRVIVACALAAFCISELHAGNVASVPIAATVLSPMLWYLLKGYQGQRPGIEQHELTFYAGRPGRSRVSHRVHIQRTL